MTVMLEARFHESGIMLSGTKTYTYISVCLPVYRALRLKVGGTTGIYECL